MRKPKNIVNRVRKDEKLLAKLGLTGKELEFLDQVELFGSLKSVDDVLFILKNIRAANSGD